MGRGDSWVFAPLVPIQLYPSFFCLCLTFPLSSSFVFFPLSCLVFLRSSFSFIGFSCFSSFFIPSFFPSSAFSLFYSLLSFLCSCSSFLLSFMSSLPSSFPSFVFLVLSPLFPPSPLKIVSARCWSCPSSLILAVISSISLKI